jgi:hypothetical protein
LVTDTTHAVPPERAAGVVDNVESDTVHGPDATLKSPNDPAVPPAAVNDTEPPNGSVPDAEIDTSAWPLREAPDFVAEAAEYIPDAAVAVTVTTEATVASALSATKSSSGKTT